MRLSALLVVAASRWGARAQGPPIAGRISPSRNATKVLAAARVQRPIAGRVSHNRNHACPPGKQRHLLYPLVYPDGTDARASVARAGHGAWIRDMAAFSESFGRPPAAGADAGDYCSHLPCVIRTDDALVAELVRRCRPAYEQHELPPVRECMIMLRTHNGVRPIKNHHEYGMKEKQRWRQLGCDSKVTQKAAPPAGPKITNDMRALGVGGGRPGAGLTTLVVLLGNARGGENSWRTLFERLLAPNAADLALLLSPTSRHNGTRLLYARAKYVWDVEDFRDWSDALDALSGGNPGWRAIAARNKKRLVFGGTGPSPRGNGVIVPYQKWVLMGKLREHGLLQRYDRFVVTRTDQFYTCDVDLAVLPPQYVWVPEGEDWGGVCDRWIVAPRSLVMKTLDILQPVVSRPKLYADFQGNPEMLVKRRWQEEGVWAFVKRFGRQMFTAAAPGDTTRWKKIKPENCVFDPYFVCLKYPEEYLSAHAGCGIGAVPSMDKLSLVSADLCTNGKDCPQEFPKNVLEKLVQGPGGVTVV